MTTVMQDNPHCWVIKTGAQLKGNIVGGEESEKNEGQILFCFTWTRTYAWLTTLKKLRIAKFGI